MRAYLNHDHSDAVHSHIPEFGNFGIVIHVFLCLGYDAYVDLSGHKPLKKYNCKYYGPSGDSNNHLGHGTKTPRKC